MFHSGLIASVLGDFVKFDLSTNWIFTQILTLSATPIPIFLIISGYYLTKHEIKDISLRHIGKFIFELLFCYLFNLILILLICLACTNTGFGPKLWQFVWSQTWQVGSGFWWYTWTTLPLLMLYPLINVALIYIPKQYTIWTILIILIISFLGGNKHTNVVHFLDIFVCQMQMLTIFICIFSMASWCKLYAKKLNIKWYVYIAVFLLIAIAIANNLFRFSGLEKNKFISYLMLDQFSPLVIIFAFAIFYLFLNIHIKYHKIINFLGSITLLMYRFQLLALFIGGALTLIIFNSFPNLNNISTKQPELVYLSLIFGSIFGAILISSIFIYPIKILSNTSNRWFHKCIKNIKR